MNPGGNRQLKWGIDELHMASDDEILPVTAYGNLHQYTARRSDPETDLYYYRARMYDPDMGRFISRDPIGDGGDAGNMGNGYAYVGGAPTAGTDPTGRLGLYIPGNDQAPFSSQSSDSSGSCGSSSASSNDDSCRPCDVGDSSVWNTYPRVGSQLNGILVQACYNEFETHKLILAAAKQRQDAGVDETIVVIGYSHGGQSALYLARWAHFNGVCIDYLVLLDRVDNFHLHSRTFSHYGGAAYTVSLYQRNEFFLMNFLEGERKVSDTGGSPQESHKIPGQKHKGFWNNANVVQRVHDGFDAAMAHKQNGGGCVLH